MLLRLTLAGLWPQGGAAAGSELAFRALGPEDRNTVRLAALQRGLKARSKGKGSTRHLIVAAADTNAAAAVVATAGGGAQSVAAVAEDGACTANLFVMVLLSSSSRMRAHLQSSWLTHGPVTMTGGDQRIKDGRNDGFDLLAARSSAAADVAAELVADANLACPLRKVFVVDDNPEPHLTLEAAVEALVGALDSAAAAAPAVGRLGSGRVGVRLQVWPKELLQGILGTLPPQPAGWELSPQTTGDGGLVGSVVVLGSGALQVGVSGSATYAGNSRETNVREAEAAAAAGGAGGSEEAAASICRAFYKLREAVQIAAVDERFTFKGAMAIDAGAAPGGWTKYLALDRGCEKVWAVDPADMELGEPLPGNIVHIRGKIQEALPVSSRPTTASNIPGDRPERLGCGFQVLAAELQAAGRRLDIFVTDLCPHNDVSTCHLSKDKHAIHWWPELSELTVSSYIHHFDANSIISNTKFIILNAKFIILGWFTCAFGLILTEMCNENDGFCIKMMDLVLTMMDFALN